MTDSTPEASPPPSSESGSDLARTALARAKASARSAPSKKAPVRRVQYGDDRDPQTVDKVLHGWLRDHGYESQVGSGSLIARWPEIVGDALADHDARLHVDGPTSSLGYERIHARGELCTSSAMYNTNCIWFDCQLTIIILVLGWTQLWKWSFSRHKLLQRET